MFGQCDPFRLLTSLLLREEYSGVPGCGEAGKQDRNFTFLGLVDFVCSAADQNYPKDERRGRTSSGTVSSGSQQGMFDTNGTYYVPDGAGNHIKTDDGTFMQGVAGGVINTQTGEFMPTN